jgi:hypothetical protein
MSRVPDHTQHAVKSSGAARTPNVGGVTVRAGQHGGRISGGRSALTVSSSVSGVSAFLRNRVALASLAKPTRFSSSSECPEINARVNSSRAKATTSRLGCQGFVSPDPRRSSLLRQ